MVGCLPSLLHCLPQGHVYTAAYIFISLPQFEAQRHLLGLNALHQHGQIVVPLLVILHIVTSRH